MVSKERMKELKPEWAFKIKGSSSAALDPAYMGARSHQCMQAAGVEGVLFGE